MGRRRQRQLVANRVVGRLHSANPSDGPRFDLYLLLLREKGAASFGDLVAVTDRNGVRQTFFEQKMGARGSSENAAKPDYRRVAREFGLVAADDEYELVLQAASLLQSPG